MRAITDRDNLHAELARHRKASRLADAIQANYPKLDLEVVAQLPSQSDEWWRSLAKNCGANPPSAASIALVCDFLRQRLNASDAIPADPFEGLA